MCVCVGGGGRCRVGVAVGGKVGGKGLLGEGDSLDRLEGLIWDQKFSIRPLNRQYYHQFLITIHYQLSYF